VIDVIEDETTEDIQRLGGAQPLDAPYLSTRIATVFRKRVGCLMLLLFTGSLTGIVMRWFEDELSAVVALSFYIPLLVGTGSNAGSQPTSTIIHFMIAKIILGLW
jgi:magnesium transporter